MPDDPALPANFTIVTLGVADLERSAAFYRDLGWEQRGDLAQGICWFKTAACWVGLFGYDALAEDIGLAAAAPDPAGQPSYRAITLGLNLGSEAAVDRAFARLRELGVTIAKPPARAEWGGYSGYFADPDGHLWEIAYAPGFALDDAGRLEIG